MPTILCVIAVVILSAGIFIPRQMHGKLSAEQLTDLENIKNESRKFYFLSLMPLVLAGIILLKNTYHSALFIYQIPAASLVIDAFCIVSVRKIISNQPQFRFVFFPFISLAITKLLLFVAFFIELNEAEQNRLFIDYL